MDDLLFQMVKLKAKGYCCAQIILILALEIQGRTDKDLVRSMGGLCFGINGSGEVCGALSGGACLIAFYAGKGADEEDHDDSYLTMIEELIGWFKERASSEYSGTRCNDILNKCPDRSICGRIVSDTYQKCMDILIAHGLDPSVTRYG
jgi:C_GCAxxG_C_C family probable redox protein